MVPVFELALGLVFVSLAVGGTVGVIIARGWLSTTAVRDPGRELNAKGTGTSATSLLSVPSFTSDSVPAGAESLRAIISTLKDAEPLSRAERIKGIPIVSNRVRVAGTEMLHRKVAAMEAIDLRVGTYDSSN
jgi:hypothetical protein